MRALCLRNSTGEDTTMLVSFGLLIVAIAAIALIRRRYADGPKPGASDTRRISIDGIDHVAHMCWEESAYVYDCTGHGHFTRVYRRDGEIIADDPEDNSSGTASADQAAAWNMLFGNTLH